MSKFVARGVVLLLGLLVYLQDINAKIERVVCYYESWAVYRNGRGKFDVENIDPSLCTHVIYAFAGVNDDGTIRVDDAYNDLYDNGGRGGYNRFVNLKKRNPSLKTMIAVGGADESSKKFSNIVSDKKSRNNFVKSSVSFLNQYNFDGLDVDWEYPNQNGGKKSDVKNFMSLMKDLKKEFKSHGYLLSAAVGASSDSASQSYEVKELSKTVDFINLMTYDLHGPWEHYTGENAPLYASSVDVTDFQKEQNVKACVEYWLKEGADPAKINLGIGAYGRSFTLDNPSNHGIGAPAYNPGHKGPYTDAPGSLGYNEILELQRNGGWNVVWNDQQKCPYAYKGNQWVGYDNPRSIREKIKYAKSKNLGGTMVWSIDTDDFHGFGGSKYPLMHSINSAIDRD